MQSDLLTWENAEGAPGSLFNLGLGFANRPAFAPGRLARLLLIALMTDDIEVFILPWRLKIRTHGFKVRVPRPGSASS
jgi:hypothetical protein